MDAVSDNLLPVLTLLERRANGDYTPDTNPDSFPAFAGTHASRAAGLGCWELFEAFVKAKKPAEGTVTRWRAVFLQMQRDFADIGANGITEDAARDWIDGLKSEERSAETVREVWLSGFPAACSAGRRDTSTYARTPSLKSRLMCSSGSRSRETKRPSGLMRS